MSRTFEDGHLINGNEGWQNSSMPSSVIFVNYILHSVLWLWISETGMFIKSFFVFVI